MSAKFRRAMFDMYHAPGGYVDRKEAAEKRKHGRTVELAGIEGDINMALQSLRDKGAMSLEESRQKFEAPEQRLRLRKGAQEMDMSRFDEGLAKEYSPRLAELAVRAGLREGSEADMFMNYFRKNYLNEPDARDLLREGLSKQEPETALPPPQAASPAQSEPFAVRMSREMRRAADTPLGYITGYKGIMDISEMLGRGMIKADQKVRDFTNYLLTPRSRKKKEERR